MISHGVFVTLALPGAIKDRQYPFSSKAGADDALIFRGPGLLVLLCLTLSFTMCYHCTLSLHIVSVNYHCALSLNIISILHIIMTYFNLRHFSSSFLVILSPFSSLSVERTALDIYAGLKQGRDVVVPGIVNKLYTYLFSQILPSAAVGAITQVRERIGVKQSVIIDSFSD